MIQGPRRAIVGILQRRQCATVDELAQAVGLAAATVRRHLDVLQRDGLVRFHPVRKKAGRPEYAYELSEVGQESLPKQYGQLLALLLSEMQRLPPGELSSVPGGRQLTDLLFARIARRVASRYERNNDGHDHDGQLQERMSQVLDALREEQFAPESETSGEGTVVRLMNCPYRSVAMEDGSVCAFDRYLISRLAATTAVREECIGHGSPCCSYRLKGPG